MILLEILLFAVSIPAFGFAFILMLVVSYERARLKGYRLPGAVLIILAGAATGITATILRNPPNSTDYRFFVDFFWLPLLFSGAATAILILVLPRKRSRVFGQRQVRFPFVWVGQAVIALGLLLIGVTVHWSLAGHGDLSLVWKGALIALGFLAPTGRYLIRRGRRLEGAPSFEQQLAQDSRSPVLYLRAFKQERQFFVIGGSAEYGAQAKSWHARVSKPEQKVGIPFEQYLSDAVEGSLGPFVALGSPEDYLAPEGARRMYAKDTDWMERLDGLARRAICILVEMGKSANLRWEFEHLRREGLQQKLFVVTRHSTEGSGLAWAFWGLVWRLQGIRDVKWKEFSSDLARLGYDLGLEDPGPGSVITFDGEGRGILLTTEADRPADFVEPIRAWATERQKIGRHVPSSCSKCGRGIYALPGEAGVAGKRCRDCEEGSPRKRTWERIAPTVYFLLGLLLFLAFFIAVAIWIPEESFVSRHIGGIGTALFIALLAIWVAVVGRMDSRAPKAAEDTPPDKNRQDDQAKEHDPAGTRKSTGEIRRRRRHRR
jgi:hypothetical protein